MTERDHGETGPADAPAATGAPSVWAELSDAMAALPPGLRPGDSPLRYAGVFLTLSESALDEAFAANFVDNGACYRAACIRLAALAMMALDHHDRVAAMAAAAKRAKADPP